MRSKMSLTPLYSTTLGVRPADVSSFRHVVLQVVVTTGGTVGAKLLFKGSGQETPVPNFAGASTQTNFHDGVQVKKLTDGSTINGATGLDITTAGVYLLEVNTNFISWLGLDTTTINTAVFTVDAVAAGGQN